MKNCAVIGFGNWGKKIVENIVLSEKFSVSCILDPNYIDRSFNKIAKCYDINDILNDANIDCVFILTSNDLHYKYGILCAQNKKDFFIEKPICNHSYEAEELLELCKINNVKLMVGHNVIFYSIFKKVYDMIQSGLIGKIYHIEANRSRPIWNTITDNSWRYYKDKCNGGPLIQMGLHLVDTIQYYCGFDAKNIKIIGTNHYMDSENCESYNIIGELDNSITFYLYSSYLPAETFFINIYGSKGVIRADAFNGLYYQKKDEFKIKKVRYSNNNPEKDEIVRFYEILNSDDYNYGQVEQAIRDVVEMEKMLNEKKSSYFKK